MDSQDLLTILQHQSALLAMLGGLVLHWVMPVPDYINPLSYCRRFAQLLSDKVNHQTDSEQQRRLSGILSFAIIWLTLAVLLVATAQLVWQPAFYNLFLLWLALGWKPTHHLGQSLATSLSAEDKGTARLLLSSHLNRETDGLSMIGLGKAGAETLLMGYGRNVVSVLFWFALLGGVGAFLYSLTSTLARVWSPSRKQFDPFGRFSASVISILDIVPLRLFALLICCGKGFHSGFQALMNEGEKWRAPGAGWLLSSAGSKWELSLGGPAIYEGRKQERRKIGGQVVPAGYHLSLLNHTLQKRTLYWIAVQSVVMLIFTL
ncbi:cobalamin biosynthesis family protein [Parasalinivibrio latis]|uniref:cobalamin biosynthesis family protein n=1 Tax=Parasalinivibrio latis TaxID=2952610 RepID=UPI0030E451DF